MDLEHAVTGTAVLSVLTLIGGFFKAYLDSRDKNHSIKIAADKEVALAETAAQNETEKTDLKMRIAMLESKIGSCEEGHKETGIKLQATDEKLRQTDEKLRACEEKHHINETKIQEGSKDREMLRKQLQQELVDMKMRLAQLMEAKQ